MVVDNWTRSAMRDGRVVAELLLRLKKAHVTPVFLASPSMSNLRWGIRQPRSRSTRYDGDSAKISRCTPNTQLSWSDGPGGSADGYESTSRQCNGSLAVGSKSTVRISLLSLYFTSIWEKLSFSSRGWRRRNCSFFLFHSFCRFFFIFLPFFKSLQMQKRFFLSFSFRCHSFVSFSTLQFFFCLGEKNDTHCPKFLFWFQSVGYIVRVFWSFPWLACVSFNSRWGKRGRYVAVFGYFPLKTLDQIPIYPLNVQLFSRYKKWLFFYFYFNSKHIEFTEYS